MSNDGDQVPKFVRSVWPAVFMAAFSIVMIVWSQDYSATASLVPTIVGSAMLVLSIIDILSRLNLPFSQFIRDFWGADFRNREMKHNPPWREDLKQFLWITGFVAGMLTIGILPSIPIFVMSYMAIRGGRSWLECLVVGGIVFGFVFVVFELLLNYTLYRGLLFDERGFAIW